ncbi:MAG: hypothetical protein ACLFV3_09185 [Phycisphaeraceae bacterium]
MTVNQRKFLAAYRACPKIVRAAEVAGIHRSCHYEWLGQPHYAEAFAQTEEAAAADIAAHMRRLALQGVRKLVIHRGRPVTWTNPDTGKEELLYETEYPVRLLVELARAHLPEFQGPRRLEHSGPGGGPIQTESRTTIDLEKLSADQLEQLERLLERAQTDAQADAESGRSENGAGEEAG